MIFGNKIKYEGSIGTAIAKVFDLTVASTGLAKRLKQMIYLTCRQRSILIHMPDIIREHLCWT